MDKKDTHHERAKQALKQYNERLITTWSVVTETCYLLLTRKGVDAEIIFINTLQEELFTIFNFKLHHTARIIELMKKYADLPMDLADASLVILAEHLGHGRIFSVDQRDFNTYCWKQSYPFENILF
ncbi:type II toxin-antitoxin system VapC family toxin [Nostoc sp. 'Peltigera membranacea cyanobiont' 210A]|uniref:type II toxin-antitoxin system VapC family toxin n=1 Tax=Nostoc sp. 'Peltigera membranacea cyanobiont' 210A TaxID=2014529 RepID=UPI0021D52943|nr:PIN domain-containing protein [Nostoc sp. 'Peltigera membranacea cyanobiont' 210A]